MLVLLQIWLHVLVLCLLRINLEKMLCTTWILFELGFQKRELFMSMLEGRGNSKFLKGEKSIDCEVRKQGWYSDYALSCVLQYLKHFQTKQVPILERFALLISVALIWAYAHLLTASGAYKHHPEETQMHCRTDKANLISAAPWLEHPLDFKWSVKICL